MLTLRHRLFMIASALISTTGPVHAADTWAELTYDEARDAVQNLGAAATDDRNAAYLTGFVFAECQDLLKTQVHAPKDGKKSFVLLKQLPSDDTAGFDHCHETQSKIKEAKLVRLSTLAGTLKFPMMTGLGDYDGEVSLVWLNYNSDPAALEYTSLESGGKALTFTSRAKREESDDEDRKRKETLRLERLDADTRSCSSKSKGQLEKALEGIEELLSHDKIDEDEAGRRRENVGEREYELLADKVESESGSELEAVDADIRDWESRWDSFKKAPESAARLRLELAQKLADDQDLSGTRGIEAGIDVLEDLAESSSTPKDQRSDAKTALTEMRSKLHQSKLSDEVQTRAARGESVASIQSSIGESRAFKSFQSEMDRSAQQACGKGSLHRSFGGCAQAQQQRQAQYAQFNALLLQELQAAERLQAAMMMDQQQGRYGAFNPHAPYGQFGGFAPMQSPYRW